MKKLVVVLLFLFLFSVAFAAIECGNLNCETGETRDSCPADCCNGDVPNQYGKEYYVKDNGRCGTRWKPNFCGNTTCDGGESFSNCPSDCAPDAISIEILEFDSNKTYMRGDIISIKVLVNSDEGPIPFASVYATGFFGVTQFFDDGKNNDDGKNDGIYAVNIVVPSDAFGGQKSVNLIAEKGNTKKSIKIKPTIKAELDVTLNLRQERFSLGDQVFGEGKIEKNGEPFSGDLNVILAYKGQVLIDSAVQSGDNGLYSFSYRTSLIDPPGIWDLNLNIVDSAGNEGRVFREVEVFEEIIVSYYSIDFEEPTSKIFNRGDFAQFLVSVKGSNGVLVTGADVVLSVPGQLPVKLKEISYGKYTYSYKIPFDFPVGEQVVSVAASTEEEGNLLSGADVLVIIVDKTEIRVEMFKPEKRLVSLGDLVEFEFLARYPDTSLVSKAIFDLKVDGDIVEVNEFVKGDYTASYLVNGENPEKIAILLSVSDPHGNAGIFESELAIKTEFDLVHLVLRDSLLTFLVGTMLIVSLAAGVLYFKKFAKGRGLEARRDELKKIMKDLKKEYYGKGKLKTVQYRGLLDRYQQELDEIDAVLSVRDKK
ncbi:MAG: hypothetical protein QGI60_05580 [archaeon]|jgi:hypothetical protein|nr:hypothetical protein [archaeon]